MLSSPSKGSLAAPPSASPFPDIDARSQDAITEEQAQFFREHGLLVIRNLLHGEELATLQRETKALIDKAREGVEDSDYRYGQHKATGQRVPFRIEYVIDKTPACRTLLAHPFVLRTVAKLQGPEFVSTGESLVFKNPGAGVVIPWHRDAGVRTVDDPLIRQHPMFNVDFYLDHSHLDNCLWGILGSNKWSDEKAASVIANLNDGGFSHGHCAIPIPMEPGDILLHDIRTLHGSPPTQSALRRVIYYEFRPVPALRHGNLYVPEYCPLKQLVLLACQRQRSRMAYAAEERPFSFNLNAGPASSPPAAANDELPTYRYAHHDYFKKG